MPVPKTELLSLQPLRDRCATAGERAVTDSHWAVSDRRYGQPRVGKSDDRESMRCRNIRGFDRERGYHMPEA